MTDQNEEAGIGETVSEEPEVDTAGRLFSPSKVKAFLKTKGMRVSGEAITQLDTEIRELLVKAVSRCRQNGRSTVKPSDL